MKMKINPSRIVCISLIVAGCLLATYLELWEAGVIPASKQEREFITMLKKSEFANQPQVAAVIADVASSKYISRGQFLAAEEAFSAASNGDNAQQIVR